MQKNHIGLWAVAALCILATGGVCAAAPVLWVDDSYSQLGTVDIGTGAVSVIGGLQTNLGDIAFDSNGKLWGVDLYSNLYSVSTTTGIASIVGNSGDAVQFNSLVGGPGGSLYAAGLNSPKLYTINSATGADTVVGTTGFAAAGDLAFVNGTLYESAVDPKNSAVDDLIKITLSPTFSATEVGSFGIPDVYGLASDDNGVLYAIAGTAIYTTNLDTAALTPLLNYAGNSAGLGPADGEAFISESAGAIASGPSPTTTLVPLPSAVWSGLILLAALAGISAATRLRQTH
jgi:hypothetical protein